ncbi:MAG: hypothetical protein M3Z05_04825 [Gemmatimonadota bacterium]|nr:hypothetical protein [Gemmatimonadota bacterium]
MLHLHTERLAELGDDTPTTEEAAHLAACAPCARERDAYRALLAMAAAEREPFGLPLTRWDAIAAELSVAEVPAQPDIAPVRGINRRMLQIAAALLLIASGAMMGRVSAGARALPGDVDQQVASNAQPTAATQPTNRLASDSTPFATTEEARAAQRRSEALYQQAAAYLARVDTTGIGSGSPVAYQSRLAALDRVISTTREAMREAPHDPVINGYYLTTLGQREATLRQLNTALPASLKVSSF